MATPTNSRPDASPLGEGLSNNLLSDLAPLLALFGEQVTKQFLTMSMGWTDNMLIALGPLGIMTILVSAVRVAGVKRLKALIGRARESITTAEVELLSSTSDEVCEMWNGVEIVRTFGIPSTTQFVIVRKDDGIRILPTWKAYVQEILVERSGRYLGQDHDAIRLFFEKAPNLSLNTPWSFVSRMEQRCWLCVGFLVQSVSLILPFVVMRSINFRFRAYSYACYVVGTIALSTGLAGCSHVIEGSTTEYEFVQNPARQDELLIMTVQQAGSIGDMQFDSYVSVSMPTRPRILISRFNDRNFKRGCTISVFAAIIGFVSQFVGLRTLHWTAIVISLGFTLIMVVIRAWVRRGLASHADFLPLKEEPEGPQLTTWIGDHISKESSYCLKSLAIPRRPDGQNRDSGWVFTPPRLLTASVRLCGGDNPDTYLVIICPELSKSDFHDGLPTCTEARLCAALRLYKISEDPDLAPQLLEAMNELATYFMRQDLFVRHDEPTAPLKWTYPVVKTYPGVVHSSERAHTAQKLVPQNIYMEALRGGECADSRRLRCYIDGQDPESILAALIELDKCARVALGHRPNESPNGLLRLHRIIGCMPYDEFNRDKGLFRTFKKYLGNTPIRVAYPILPFSENPKPHGEEIRRSNVVYGYHYSSSWQASSHESSAVQAKSSHERPFANLYIECENDGYGRYREECAREMFSIFILTIASHLKPLGEHGVYEEVIQGGQYPSATRHPVLETIVEIMIQAAPILCPTREDARQMIVPAFIKHNLLPSWKEEPETQS